LSELTHFVSANTFQFVNIDTEFVLENKIY
jgi:hypothetical protein